MYECLTNIIKTQSFTTQYVRYILSILTLVVLYTLLCEMVIEISEIISEMVDLQIHIYGCSNQEIYLKIIEVKS